MTRATFPSLKLMPRLVAAHQTRANKLSAMSRSDLTS